MNSSKSANLLMVAHNYEEQGKKVLVLKSSKDTRSKPNVVESRVGISHEAIMFNEEDSLYNLIVFKILPKGKIDCILVDECHWLTERQVIDLTDVVDRFKIPCICYGLKNSYVTGYLFEGTKALLYFSDSVEEIKNTCHFCNRKAIMNLRILKGQPVYSGQSTHIGDIKEGEDYYLPTCRKRYFEPPI